MQSKIISRVRATTQTESSKTSSPPELMDRPYSDRTSKSRGRGSSLSGANPPEGPPIWRALKWVPSASPPPYLSKISSRVIPRGTSNRPWFLTAPWRWISLVPESPGAPRERYHSGPLSRIRGTWAQVSGSWTTVGQPNNPEV